MAKTKTESKSVQAESQKRKGRPKSYDEKVKPYLAQIQQWKGDRKTEASIAQTLGISQDTFIQYKKAFPELVEVLKNGEEIVDKTVEDSLLKRAVGFEYDEVTQEKTGGKVTKTKVTRKYVVPDVGAIAFWLRNRKPDVWKDRQVLIRSDSDEASEKNKIDFTFEIKDLTGGQTLEK